MSLIEVVIYLGLLVTITLSMIMITLAIGRSSSEGCSLVRIQERNRSAFNRIVDDFRYSIAGTMVISGGGKILQFTRQNGFDGTGPIPGTTVRYEIRLAAGETLNGADDNGNGLIDEGRLVRVENGKEVILSETLDVGGTSFATSGSGLAINLTSAGATPGRGTTAYAELSTTMAARNAFP